MQLLPTILTEKGLEIINYSNNIIIIKVRFLKNQLPNKIRLLSQTLQSWTYLISVSKIDSSIEVSEYEAFIKCYLNTCNDQTENISSASQCFKFDMIIITTTIIDFHVFLLKKNNYKFCNVGLTSSKLFMKRSYNLSFSCFRQYLYQNWGSN